MAVVLAPFGALFSVVVIASEAKQSTIDESVLIMDCHEFACANSRNDSVLFAHSAHFLGAFKGDLKKSPQNPAPLSRQLIYIAVITRLALVSRGNLKGGARF